MTETLGSYLHQQRKTAHLTLRDVEESTGVSNAYLSQLENDKISAPSPTILHKLAECYGISYGQLMKLTGYPVGEEKKEPFYRSASEFENLTPDEREKVREYIEFLKSRRRQE
jgi:transcriptional regulator with XRE-family HTH domain